MRRTFLNHRSFFNRNEVAGLRLQSLCPWIHALCGGEDPTKMPSPLRRTFPVLCRGGRLGRTIPNFAHRSRRGEQFVVKVVDARSLSRPWPCRQCGEHFLPNVVDLGLVGRRSGRPAVRFRVPVLLSTPYEVTHCGALAVCQLVEGIVFKRPWNGRSAGRGESVFATQSAPLKIQ